MSSLSEYIASQESLEQEARNVLPYDPSECTFQQGPLRQQLYACITCYRSTSKLNAICYACSINCHTSHELIELFTKRSRTCDCGTDRFNSPCFTRYPKWRNLSYSNEEKYICDISDSNNRYSHNFKGNFCSCDQQYNPLTDSNMIQCTLGAACDEDWFHEECLMGLRAGVITRKRRRHLDGTNKLESLSDPELDAETASKKGGENKSAEGAAEEEEEEDDDDLLPIPGFPSLDSFETIICWKCMQSYPQDIEKLKNLLDADVIQYIESDSLDDRLLKLRGCSIELDKTKRHKRSFPYTLLLKEDYKTAIKKFIDSEEVEKDAEFKKFLNKFDFLYNEDPIFIPEEDEDDNSSVFELGVRELQNLPNDQALLGLQAYNKIKSKLTEFLKPFANEGKIVTEDEVKNFFNKIQD